VSAKRIIVIAGPNGAGKTTFARELLPNEADCPVFVNADLIAAGLSPFAPEQAAIKAGRLMLEIMDEHERRGESFAFETTLSGKAYAQSIPRWQAGGYRVTLFFLAMPTSERCIERVAVRVRQGGHFVPDEVVRRRFESGRRNFDEVYRSLVDDWAL
jgi:predicted ABC-type ATPase